MKQNEKNEIAVEVKNVTARFNMASEKIDNLKEYFIKLVKRELMFEEFLALKNVSFSVKKGESWGIIGINGSGKSTLLKVICGILKPYKGTVTVNGTIAPLIELGAGFDGDLTARENIYLNGAVLGHDEQFMKEHFDEIVEFAELENFLDMPIKNYSSGMAARLGFAIATVVKPDILICDEVLAVGDYAFQRKCEKRMKKMREEGTTLDLFHVGHLNILEKAKENCEYLVVGVSTDELVKEYKGEFPIIPFEDRLRIVKSLKCVDQVIPQKTMNKLEVLTEINYNVLFHGDDWKNTKMYNEIEEKLKQKGVSCVYFPYTKSVSTKSIKEKIREEYKGSER